jgi:hypothetical protein
MNKTRIIVVIALLSLLTLSAFSTINTNTFVQAADEYYLSKPDILSGSGQIATAHWIGTRGQTIDAYFAEQLTIDDTVVLNGLYIEVLHAFDGGFYSGNYISVSDLNIERAGSGEILSIDVEANLFFFNSPTSSKDHLIHVVWNFVDESASIEITNHNRGNDYVNDDAVVMVGRANGPSVKASVNKLSGNKNELTITATSATFDFLENAPCSSTVLETFSINNNAAAVYVVGNYYSVFVDTKGNDQIRACYFV